MLFNTPIFTVFFIAVAILYYVLPKQLRWIGLLAASIVFYMWSKPEYVAIPLLITLCTYYCGIKIEEASTPSLKSRFFWIGILVNIGILVFFKYFNFLSSIIFDFKNTVLNSEGNAANGFLLNVIVPLGISYITFQAIGYLIDMYRTSYPAERHLGHFSTYMLFFPKIVAGPVERPYNFLPQIKDPLPFDSIKAAEGLKLLLWGLFKKVVIADRLGIFVNKVFGHVPDYEGLTLIVACVFYTLQMYYDFSGYTDMAKGLAKVLGIDLMENFNRPFSAKSITELWRKWHISLSTWFSDYFFNPLSIDKRGWGKWGVVYASMITFVILGFWHGANWTFILYGFLHGIILSIEFLTRKYRKDMRKKIPTWLNDSLGILFTFTFFSLSLIIFRSESVAGALLYFKKMFIGLGSMLSVAGIKSKIFIGGLDVFDMMILAFTLLLVEWVQYKDLFVKIATRPQWLRWAAYYFIMLLIIIFGVTDNAQFIYFQF